MPNTFDPRPYVFSAGEAASLAAAQFLANKEGASRALSLDQPLLRDYFVPVLPGQFAAVIGQTSNFKTGFMKMWMNQQAEALTKSKRRAAIISIHTEDPLEDVLAAETARIAEIPMRELVTGRITDWAPVHMALSKLGTVPIIRIAYSSENIPARPTLSLSNIEKCVAFACKTWEIDDIASMWLDYLQAMANEDRPDNSSGEEKQRLRVRDNVFGYRRMLGRWKAPGVLGVQATTDLKFAYSQTLRIPSQYDGQETSAVGQHAQRVIGLWLPKMTPQVGKYGVDDEGKRCRLLEYDGHSYAVTDNLLFAWVCKQQGNLPSGKVFVYEIDYATGRLKKFDFGDDGAAPHPKTAKPVPLKGTHGK